MVEKYMKDECMEDECMEDEYITSPMFQGCEYSRLFRFVIKPRVSQSMPLTFFLMCCITDLTIDELVHLKWSDFDFKNRTLHIQHRYSSSPCNCNRDYLLSNNLVNMLQDVKNYMEIRLSKKICIFDNHRPVICTNFGTPYSELDLQSKWDRFTYKAICKQTYFEDLRYVFEDFLYNDGLYAQLI